MQQLQNIEVIKPPVNSPGFHLAITIVDTEKKERRICAGNFLLGHHPIDVARMLREMAQQIETTYVESRQ